MNDAFDNVHGALSPEQNLSTDTSTTPYVEPKAEYSEPEEVLADDTVVQNTDVVDTPNGFQLMGLAPELLQAVQDLGFTQPTVVQEKCIPMAMQDLADSAKGAKCPELMVSSQTRS